MKWLKRVENFLQSAADFLVLWLPPFCLVAFLSAVWGRDLLGGTPIAGLVFPEHLVAPAAVLFACGSLGAVGYLVFAPAFVAAYLTDCIGVYLSERQISFVKEIKRRVPFVRSVLNVARAGLFLGGQFTLAKWVFEDGSQSRGLVPVFGMIFVGLSIVVLVGFRKLEKTGSTT